MASSKSTSNRMLYAGGGLLLVLFVAGGLGWQLGWFGGGERGLSVEAEQAERRTITQVVTAFGRAQPEVEVEISPDVPGEIVELPVQEGDVVEQGDLLARLEAEDYRASVERAQAGVSEAKATLAQRRADSVQARRTYDRQKELYEKEVVPASDFEEAESTYEQAVAQLEAARFRVESTQADLQDAREQLQKTRIYAPMAGTITRLEVEEGERVVGTQQRAGTEMMRVSRLGQMELEVDVNESDVVNVASRDSATIEFDAHPDRSFQGAVTEIANSARIQNEGSQNEVTNFPVTIRVLNNPNTGLTSGEQGAIARPEVPPTGGGSPVLRPGMSGAVDIYTETAEDAVAVPIQAVTVRDFAEARSGAPADTAGQDGEAAEDLRRVVFVAEGDSARMVEVNTGVADDTYMEIKAGLEGGETVITGPYSAISRNLEPGMKIRTGEEGGQSGETIAMTQ
ncbi:efflux RND transporter periplasmic adaptor subunit [Salinibacter altiplanensis]|uniref:efflux RND transporter periplasmic adaptor subunit n=1 Tax=Salinibacter altiplanensis TaxID=1803181 RepID=UPI000C9FDBA9|nr:efflux RND transporter periplasmic adaptor subunit [Salinibacter altiplanensis]